ncbi:MAG: hypothetical protein KUG74_16770 [Rhodobacteraceae bacterium]|nr:hypothetical protein [Paracoccaceae bacterium]
MAAYIVRGVPKSILKDGWWLTDTTAEMHKVDNGTKVKVFWKDQKATGCNPMHKQQDSR